MNQNKVLDKSIFKYIPNGNDFKFALKEAQDVLRETLKRFQSFCEHYNIKFSLTYGSLIGAVRHNGFIPWDDDIDLMVDFNSFELIKDKLSELSKFGLNYYHYTNSKKCYCNEIRIYIDGYYKVLSERNKKEYLTPLCIDIFLFSNVAKMANGDISKRNKKRIKKMIVLKKILIQKNARYASSSFLKSIIRKLIKMLLFFIPSKIMLKKVDKIILKMQKESKENYYLFSSFAIESSKIMFDKEMFKKINLVPFDNIKTYIIQDYNSFLEKIYGDWKTPIDRTNGNFQKEFFVRR